MKHELEEVKKELEKDILGKIESIKLKILTGEGTSDLFTKIEMLTMISDELSDVLLNWSERMIDSNLGNDLM
jgi:hypothetical protein